jgi:hypothetical protein
MKQLKPLLAAGLALMLSGVAHAASLVDSSLATWSAFGNSSIYTWSLYSSTEQSGLPTPLPASPAGTSNDVGFSWYLTNSSSGMQTYANVVQGQTYTLSYYEAAADRTAYGSTPPASSIGKPFGWDVTLGNQTLTTVSTTSSDIAIPSAGSYTPWTLVTLTFVANATGNELLKFLGDSTVAVSPEPILLLNDVSLVASSNGHQTVPEPNILWLIFAGVMIAAGMKQRSDRLAAVE